MSLEKVTQAIWNATSGQSPGALEELAQYAASGCDLNALHADSGFGILHCAAEHEAYAIIEAMAELGADMNIRSHSQTGENYPAIFQAIDIDIDGAIQTRKPITFQTTLCFLNAGADGSATDQEGRTLEQFATQYGFQALEAFKLLVQPVLDQPGHVG